MALIEALRSAAAPEPEADISFDQLASIIANERRRHVIRLTADGPADIGSLSEFIAAREAGPNYDTQDRKRVYVSLHQTHLDKLARVGIIIREGQDVRPGRNHPGALAAIDSLAGHVAGNGEVHA